MPPIATGGYDWLALWRTWYDAERAQAEALPLPDPGRASDCWAGQAERFAASARRNPQPDAFLRFVLPHVRPTDRVLDIGAGSGRYLPLLAQTVAEVVAIEPSAAMRAQLERRLAEEAPATARRVQVVAEGWPAASVAAGDVAICAHVVYAVREIGPFLQAMYTSARRAGFLFIALRHPSGFVSPFWEAFYGQPRLPLPGALECLNVLYQLGIPARLSLLPASHFSYADANEALADLRWRLRLPTEPASDAKLATLIAQLLEPDAERRLAPRAQWAHTAVIWWNR